MWIGFVGSATTFHRIFEMQNWLSQSAIALKTLLSLKAV